MICVLQLLGCRAATLWYRRAFILLAPVCGHQLLGALIPQSDRIIHE